MVVCNNVDSPSMKAEGKMAVIPQGGGRLWRGWRPAKRDAGEIRYFLRGRRVPYCLHSLFFSKVGHPAPILLFSFLSTIPSEISFLPGRGPPGGGVFLNKNKKTTKYFFLFPPKRLFFVFFGGWATSVFFPPPMPSSPRIFFFFFSGTG